MKKSIKKRPHQAIECPQDIRQANMEQSQQEHQEHRTTMAPADDAMEENKVQEDTTREHIPHYRHAGSRSGRKSRDNFGSYKGY